MHLLIAYVPLINHPDPLFEEFTHGDGGSRARKIKKDLKKGDYVFFHTSMFGKKYITAYYVVDRVIDTHEAIKNKNIMSKYKNPHLSEFLERKVPLDEDNAIIFGDPIESMKLDRPLLFDKKLAQKLSLNIKFPKRKTETQAIGSATRSYRELTDKDVKVLRKEIELSKNSKKIIETILSTDEVTEIIEKDLEGFIEINPGQIGRSLKFIRRQVDTPVGRIDLFFEDDKGNPVIVELKLNKIGRDALNQIKKYMIWAEKETKKKVTGIIVCRGVMPAFQEEFRKLKNIRIFTYGWKLSINPWEI